MTTSLLLVTAALFGQGLPPQSSDGVLKIAGLSLNGVKTVHVAIKDVGLVSPEGLLEQLTRRIHEPLRERGLTLKPLDPDDTVKMGLILAPAHEDTIVLRVLYQAQPITLNGNTIYELAVRCFVMEAVRLVRRPAEATFATTYDKRVTRYIWKESDVLYQLCVIADAAAQEFARAHKLNN